MRTKYRRIVMLKYLSIDLLYYMYYKFLTRMLIKDPNIGAPVLVFLTFITAISFIMGLFVSDSQHVLFLLAHYMKLFYLFLFILLILSWIYISNKRSVKIFERFENDRIANSSLLNAILVIYWIVFIGYILIFKLHVGM